MSRCGIEESMVQESEFLKSVKLNVRIRPARFDRIRESAMGNVGFQFFLFYMDAVLTSTNSEAVACFSPRWKEELFNSESSLNPNLR